MTSSAGMRMEEQDKKGDDAEMKTCTWSCAKQPAQHVLEAEEARLGDGPCFDTLALQGLGPPRGATAHTSWRGMDLLCGARSAWCRHGV